VTAGTSLRLKNSLKSAKQRKLSFAQVFILILDNLIEGTRVLIIQGFLLPKEKDEYLALSHHILLGLDYVSQISFKIIYFHSKVKGRENRGHSLIKRICNSLTPAMRDKL